MYGRTKFFKEDTHMKNLKRIACLVLAIAVVCSLGLTALAASEDPYVSVTADTRGEAFPDVKL